MEREHPKLALLCYVRTLSTAVRRLWGVIVARFVPAAVLVPSFCDHRRLRQLDGGASGATTANGETTGGPLDEIRTSPFFNSDT